MNRDPFPATRRIRANNEANRPAACETGLLDVIPRRASKLHAIEALMRQPGMANRDVLFSGDSTYQWDLNYTNPAVFTEMLDIIIVLG